MDLFTDIIAWGIFGWLILATAFLFAFNTYMVVGCIWHAIKTKFINPMFKGEYQNESN